MSFTEKYRPRKLDEVFVSKEKILMLKKLILEKKPVIMNGPTGSGKTSLVYALADELNYDVFEINGSDYRNKNNIDLIVKPSSLEGSLFGRGRIILIDDIEGLSGTKDRGGVQALANVLNESKWPIVITTTDAYNQKISILRKRSGLIEIDPFDSLTIFNILKKICDNEDIIYDEAALKELSRRASGDIRAAINDLQNLTSKNKELGKESLESLDDREKKEEIFTALNLIFKGREIGKVVNSIEKTDVDLDEAFLWIDENLPLQYLKNKDLFSAYESLSKADIFNGRIIRWQYWRFLVYRNFFMTAGVALSKEDKYINFSSYRRSSKLLKLFWAKQKNLKKISICEKISEKNHVSVKRAVKDVYPYIKLIYKSGRKIDELDLDEEEIEYLRK
ncbi:MAG: replication factor C large subunit [Nanoarchaeota archaeon]